MCLIAAFLWMFVVVAAAACVVLRVSKIETRLDALIRDVQEMTR
jgi:hypothetical protein